MLVRSKSTFLHHGGSGANRIKIASVTFFCHLVFHFCVENDMIQIKLNLGNFVLQV